jgi:paraquat-inducible protein A
LTTRDGTAGPMAASFPTARRAGLLHCHICGLLSLPPPGPLGGLRCPRCRARLRIRRADSLARTWALLLGAVLCYLPANLLPIMTVTSLGVSQSDTILSGAAYLLAEGMWPLALIVFVASICIPVLKIAVLSFLLVSVSGRWRWRPVDRSRLYRLVDAVGRWSMVDVFVVSVLVALVRMGNFATVQAEAGALFFAAVVVLTMFAAMSFDPRLIWDAMEGKDG